MWFSSGFYEMYQQTVVQEKEGFVDNILYTFSTNAVWLNQN